MNNTINNTPLPSSIYITNSSNYPNLSVSDTISAQLVVNGKDVMKIISDLGDRLKEIEDRLNIIPPNIELEERWESLSNMRKEYKKMEKSVLYKEEILNKLKE